MIHYSWLKSDRKCLTTEQLSVVMAAFSDCQLPLFLKLCYDEACSWSSFTQVSRSALADTVHSAIYRVFDKMEIKYGVLLASRVFAYVTASKCGVLLTSRVFAYVTASKYGVLLASRELNFILIYRTNAMFL